jgi:hypothetical protein
MRKKKQSIFSFIYHLIPYYSVLLKHSQKQNYTILIENEKNLRMGLEWNGTDCDRPKYSEERLSQLYFVHRNATRIVLGSHRALSHQTSENNCLSHDRTQFS